MSTKAMGRLYTGSGGPSFTSRNDLYGNPSLLSSLFGQDAISGGLDIDPTNGEDMYTPYQGSSGIFGGQSRRLATMLNAQHGSQMTEIQGNKDLQKMINEHQAAIEKMHNEAVKEMAKLKNVQDIAAKYGVTPEQYVGDIMQQVTANTLKQQQLRGNSLNKPEAQKATDTGVGFEQSNINPNVPIPTAQSGGIAAFRNPNGGVGTIVGATPRQTSLPYGITGKDGTYIPMGVKTMQDYSPAGITLPIDKMQYDQAKMQGPPASSQLNPSPNFPAGAAMNPGGFLSTDSPPNPGLPQDNPLAGPMGISPMPANDQTPSGTPKRFYNPQEMQQGQGFREWYQNLLQNFQRQGSQFNPASLIGAF